MLLKPNGKLIFFNESARKMLKIGDGLNLFNSRASIDDLGTIEPRGIWNTTVNKKEILFSKGEASKHLLITTEVKSESIIVFLEEETPENIRFIQAESIYPVSVSIIAGIDDRIREKAAIAARSDIPVIITGETGTGKEVMARAIHLSSPRTKNPFVVVDCCSLPASLIESELFGYEPGSFTGAVREGRAGKFELADGGTIFLDEVGDMPVDLQPKLLRVLNDSLVTRIGGKQHKKVDIRVIAATNKNLKDQMAIGNFREDLYYRLFGTEINLPPLRERRQFISDLILLFSKKHRADSPLEVSAQALDALKNYKWPGNVRELEKTVQYLISLKLNRQVRPDDLPENIGCETWSSQQKTLKEALRECECRTISQALAMNGNNITIASEKLGLSRYGLQTKINRLGIEIKKPKKRRVKRRGKIYL